MSEGWYYAEGDNTVGPLSLDDLRTALRRQQEAGRVLVWKEGFADWMEARSVSELARIVAGPPPLPARSVAPPAAPERSLSPLSPEYRQAVQDEKKPRNWMGTIAGWVAVALSVVLSRVLGGAYWMPILLIALSIWIFTKLKLRDYAVWMFGVLVGHTLWMTIGHATIYAMGKPDPEFYTFLFDVVVVTALTIWGIRTQSVTVSVAVLIYQIIALATNVVFFDEYSKISPIAAGMHIALRVLGIGLAIYAIVKARRFKREEGSEPAVA
jgi:preprotein translocase subunit SecE